MSLVYQLFWNTVYICVAKQRVTAAAAASVTVTVTV